MKKLTQNELTSAARLIADTVILCDTDQRHELYRMVSVELTKQTQFFQSTHFKAISYADKNGFTIGVPK